MTSDRARTGGARTGKPKRISFCLGVMCKQVGRGLLTSVIAFFFPFKPIVLPAFLAAIPVVVGLAGDPANAVFAAAPVADGADVGEDDADEADDPGDERVDRPIDSCSIST
jgi:hypothetical protein